MSVQPQPVVYHPEQPSAGAPVTDDPGFVLGVISIVCAYVVSVVGIVLGVIALQQSRRAGFQNPTAIAGIILSAGVTAITAVMVVVSIVLTLVIVLIVAVSTGDINELRP